MILFATLLALLTPVADPPFSVADILSAPFPASLTAAPSSDRVAWTFNAQGQRNVWGAEAPGFEARRLTSYDHDDGRAVRIVGFSASGEDVVYVRDHRFNPDHRPSGPGGFELHAVSWSGEDRLLGRVASAAIGPKQERVFFLRDNALWTQPLDGGEAQKRFSTRGSLSSLTVDPTGRRVAMVVSRGVTPDAYSYVIFFDLEADKVHYIDSSIYRDEEPSWSPDGRYLAFRRRFERNVPFVLIAKEFPAADPWALRVYDTQEDKAHLVWRSPDEDTAAYAEHQWAGSDHLVFVSERDGWRRLYGIHRNGGEAVALSPTGGIVEETRVGGDGALYYVSNASDIDRRHLWRVDYPKQTTPKAVTRGDSIEWSPRLSSSGRYLFYLGSDAIRPAQVYSLDLREAKKSVLAASTLPESFPLQELVRPESITLEAADGVTCHAQLFRPKHKSEVPGPALLFFHGGPIRQMLLGWHYRGYYHNAYAMNQLLAAQGYHVLSVNFRLGVGYGRQFRDVPDGGPRGASEYRDLLAGAKYLRSLPGVDDQRIGLWGGSYGGYLTALGLARNSDLFFAGVDFHGVHDWNLWQAAITGQTDDYDRVAWQSSPSADLDSWSSPVLLIHGDDDRNVPFSETQWLADALKERGVEYELLVFPDEVHSFLLHKHWVEAFEATARFFAMKSLSSE